VQSPSSEANDHSASQEITSLLWNPKLYYRVNKSLPLAPILSHMNPFYLSHPISLRFILIVSSHLCLGLPSGLSPSGFPTKFCVSSHLSHYISTLPDHLIFLDMITLVIFGEEYNL